MRQSFNAFQSLLKDVSSYEEIDAKVAELTQRGELSPALMLTASKMYMSVKESPYTSEEVKDIMGHLYWRMKASMAELQPPAVRILRHILSLDDPAERQAALEQAFTPGPEMSLGQDDMLYTCVPRCTRVRARTEALRVVQHPGSHDGAHERRDQDLRNTERAHHDGGAGGGAHDPRSDRADA